MARASLLPLVLLGWLQLPLPDWLPRPHLPVWAERWLYNPRERTEAAIDAWEEGRPEDAVDSAETALRLAPEDPRAQYNAGTAHLAARNERKAVKLLEEATREGDPELAPAAHYNLGNARLGAGDPAGAVQAYKAALRLTPDDLNAKWNLELALKELEKQRRGGQGQRQGNRGRNPQQNDPSGQGGQGRPDDQRQDRSRGQNPSEQQGQGQQPDQQGRQGDAENPSEQRDGRLPGYKNQPEMSAREAAAVLSAVEDLERRQRRADAAKRARERSGKEKDW